MKLTMQFFRESVFLSFLLVTGLCILGVLVKEIYVMRRQLKIEMGARSRERRQPARIRKAA